MSAELAFLLGVFAGAFVVLLVVLAFLFWGSAPQD
jgi:hypothetical protein